MLKRLLILIIKFYKKWLSPLKKSSSCRFYPTCSTYGIEAITKYGAFKGVYMLLKRILKCHPFHPGGYDPVK